MITMIMSLVPLLVMVAAYAWFGVMLGKLFAQLGTDSKKAWIPIINQLEMLRLVNRPSLQIVFILFVPLYGLWIYYQVLQDMTRLCGRDEKLALLGLLLPPVWAGKMLNEGAVKPGTKVKAGGAQAPGQGQAPQQTGVGSLFGPPVQDAPAPPAYASPSFAPAGYVPPAPPEPVATPAYAEPFAPVAPAGPPTAAWSAGADPAWSSPAWAAPAPAAPVPSADPYYAAAAQTPPAAALVAVPVPAQPALPVQPSPLASAQPPQMPAQPSSYPVAVPAAAQPSPPPPQPSLQPVQPGLQPGPQSQVMAQPVLRPVAVPTPVQPGPQLAQPSLVQPGPSPVQLVQAPQVVAQPAALPAAAPMPVQPGPAPARPALHAVPSDNRVPEVGPDEPVERTVLIDRAASQQWSLLLDDGRRFDLWAPSVIVGRAPSTTGPGTQALAISDETCTISKMHARLDLVNGAWHVTDAGSTNGIIVTRGGRAFTVPSGTTAAVGEQLVLGSVGMRLVPGQQSAYA